MRIRLSILLVAAATQLGATDCGEVIRDPGFDLWCGDNLCTWKVVRGDVKRVDTWHEGDSGVELLGDDAAIAQLTPVNSNDGTCIQFDMLTDIDEHTNAQLGIDVYGDGTIEHHFPIPTSDWEPISFKIRLAKPYSGIRFELMKNGPGRAAFANIGARTTEGCDGLDLIDGNPAPNGAPCTMNVHCKSTMCRLVPDPQSLAGMANRCVACDATTCGASEVCGIDEPISPVIAVPLECVPSAGDEVGEQCASASECASGICTDFACSTCGPANPCANGEVCGFAWENGPHVCSPGAMLRQSGQPCATDGDCASGTCNGAARKACSDNRPCGNETNCPTIGLTPGECTIVGVQGGSCS